MRRSRARDESTSGRDRDEIAQTVVPPRWRQSHALFLYWLVGADGRAVGRGTDLRYRPDAGWRSRATQCNVLGAIRVRHGRGERGREEHTRTAVVSGRSPCPLRPSIQPCAAEFGSNDLHTVHIGARVRASRITCRVRCDVRPCVIVFCRV